MDTQENDGCLDAVRTLSRARVLMSQIDLQFDSLGAMPIGIGLVELREQVPYQFIKSDIERLKDLVNEWHLSYSYDDIEMDWE